MTAAEFKIQFLIFYDKVAGSSAPPYEDSEIESFLNKAQLQYIKSHYDFKKNRSKEGVEETEKRRKDLAELIRNANPTVSQSQSGVNPNGSFYDLPSDLMYTLKEEVSITSDDDCINNKRIPVKPVTHDEYNAYIYNPFKKPDDSLVWRMDFSADQSVIVTTTTTTNSLGISIPSVTVSSGAGTKRHELITDGTYKISQYHLRYIKTPKEISITNNITSELNSNIHEEIVDIAVRMATAITSPSEYQIKAAEQQFSE